MMIRGRVEPRQGQLDAVGRTVDLGFQRRQSIEIAGSEIDGAIFIHRIDPSRDIIDAKPQMQSRVRLDIHEYPKLMRPRSASTTLAGR